MIPKVIYRTWKTKTFEPEIQKIIDDMMKLNKDYKHIIYDDDEMDAFVKENFTERIFKAYNDLNIITAKADFWRYLIMYKYGGIYLDMDSDIKINLDTFIKEDDTAIISKERSDDFLQWCLMFEPRHIIMKETIKVVLTNIEGKKYGNDLLKTTGPTAFSVAISRINKRYRIKCDPKKISNNTNFLVQRDDLKYRIFGIDYNGYAKWKMEEHAKLYKKKKHWMDEIKEKKLFKSMITGCK